uniref:DNA polymerase III subunit delta n=1 Tax=Desulfobacca acetoxidans TaxID=60893 RepID=A0A7C5EKZ0_9BACT
MHSKPTSTDTTPLFFRDILGQERVLAYLRAALRTGRLAHAYLFLGPEGVGKESVARALAGALNCLQPREDGDACGACPSCKRLAAESHPDFLVLRPTSEGRQPQIKIDQIRELRRLTAYPPVAGGWRVVLLKPAEALNDAAANSLLKILEEPPPQHLLILTAKVEADLFLTVVSRCQKLSFSPLPPNLIEEKLRARGLNPAQAALLSAISGGSLGRALALEPEELLQKRDRVLRELQDLSQGSATQVLEWAQALAKSPEETDAFLLLAQLWYRDLLLLASGGPERLVAHQDGLRELKRQVQRPHMENWFKRLAALSTAQRQLLANLNPELTLDLLGFRLQERGEPVG